LGVLEGLVDAHAPTVEELRAKHGGRALSLEDALADSAIQAVAIAAPAAAHFALA
jgi:predicted dehydrogenase